MTNDSIDDICNCLEKGENRTSTLIATEDVQIGKAILKNDDDHMRNIKAADNAVPLGIAGQRYDKCITDSYASGESARIIEEGYSCAFIENDGSAHREGELLYAGTGATTNDGYLSFTKPTETLDSAEPFAQLQKDMDAGDTVGIIKILR